MAYDDINERDVVHAILAWKLSGAALDGTQQMPMESGFAFALRWLSNEGVAQLETTNIQHPACPGCCKASARTQLSWPDLVDLCR